VRACILTGLFLLTASAASALNLGATRDQVIAELGKPTSTAARGDHEILLYPKGVRLDLEGGRVVSAKGISLADPAAVATTAEPPTPVKPAEAGPAKASTLPQSTSISPVAEPDASQDMAKVQARLEKSVEAVVDHQDQALRAPPKPSFNGVSFAVGVILKLLMTVAALKLACKYWGCEVFWSGILTVAVVDALVRAGMTLLGIVVLGFPTLFYADEATAALVMVLVLKKVSINRSTAQAVQLTLTTKTFTIVVGSFLVTVILRLLH